MLPSAENIDLLRERLAGKNWLTVTGGSVVFHSGHYNGDAVEFVLGVLKECGLKPCERYSTTKTQFGEETKLEGWNRPTPLQSGEFNIWPAFNLLIEDNTKLADSAGE